MRLTFEVKMLLPNLSVVVYSWKPQCVLPSLPKAEMPRLLHLITPNVPSIFSAHSRPLGDFS